MYIQNHTMYKHWTCTIVPLRTCTFHWYQHHSCRRLKIQQNPLSDWRGWDLVDTQRHLSMPKAPTTTKIGPDTRSWRDSGCRLETIFELHTPYCNKLFVFMITWLGLQHKARLQMNVHCMIKGGMLPQIWNFSEAIWELPFLLYKCKTWWTILYNWMGCKCLHFKQNFDVFTTE